MANYSKTEWLKTTAIYTFYDSMGVKLGSVQSWAVFFHSIWHWLGSLTHLHSEGGWAGSEGPRRLHSHLAPQAPPLASRSPCGLSSASSAAQVIYGTAQPPKGIAALPAHSVGQNKSQASPESPGRENKSQLLMEGQGLMVTIFEGYLPQSMDEKMNRQMSYNLPYSSHSG